MISKDHPVYWRPCSGTSIYLGLHYLDQVIWNDKNSERDSLILANFYL